MIDTLEAKVGFHVFYQKPHMSGPEYGLITNLDYSPSYVHVLFLGDTTAKACYPRDLYWPPYFCKADRANPPAQVFGT